MYSFLEEQAKQITDYQDKLLNGLSTFESLILSFILTLSPSLALSLSVYLLSVSLTLTLCSVNLVNGIAREGRGTCELVSKDTGIAAKVIHQLKGIEMESERERERARERERNIVYCVLCIVYCVLCIVYCMCRESCVVRRPSCVVRCVLCIAACGLYVVCCMLYVVNRKRESE
jgi:hypothetical protein